MTDEFQHHKAAAPLDREDVMARIRKKFGSALAFERKNDLRHRSVRDVLSARCVNDRTARAISESLAIPLHLVSRHYFELHNPVGTSSSAAEPNHSLNARGE